MSIPELSGKVLTVLGPIDPDQLGITSIHEHLLIDMGCFFVMPEEASQRGLIDKPLTMDLLGQLGRIWPYHLDTGRLWDVRIAIEEVLAFKYAGGNSIVDVTSIGIGRDPLALARISRATGLNIVMGGGYYVSLSRTPEVDEKSEEELAEGIVRDITVGVGETGVRSGIIGEIGSFWPMSDTDPKVLRAAALAQRETGAAISIHPGFHPDALLEIMRILTDAGADPRRVAMGHLDVFPDLELLKALADMGCFLEFDTFGSEDTSFGAVAGQPITVPTDVQRMDRIAALIDMGYLDRIVIGQDVFIKRSLARYGGKGYAKILDNIAPRMRSRGFTEEQVHAIFVENPKRVLTFP